MKNIHLIPTDNKPSRLYFNVNDKEFQICEIEKPSTILKPNRHIYITSDEEIKEGDWVLNSWNEIHQITKNDKSKSYKKTCKKIILTTDQDLIKDGVQSIDDEFLEWFVENPSCEEVDVVDDWNSPRIDAYEYKIIIPKEEHKQDKIMERFIANAKQETLEEAAEKLQKDKYGIFISKDADVKGQLVIDTAKAAFLSGMIEGAKWQQERSYSEEEVLGFGKFCVDKIADFLDGKGDQTDGKEYSMKELLEKFKKK
jgi:hypothetical protein